jgi:ATP-binding cassette, subfamily C, bacterial CydC
LRLLHGYLTAPYPRMIRIRGAQALNRLTADIDALDGVSLRLILPALAGILTQVVAFILLWVLVGLPIALWVLLGYLAGAAIIFWLTVRRTAALSRRAEAAGQAFRSRLIDMILARRDLAVQGGLTDQANWVRAADDRRRTLRADQDRADRFAGAAIQMLGTVIAAGSLWLGTTMVQAGSIAAPFAALGLFATLALAETLAGLRRAASDLGRMAEAARRVSRDVAEPLPALQSRCAAEAVPLRIDAVTLHRPLSTQPIIQGFSLTVAAGETVAITGPSGVGKSTLLLAVAALHPVSAGSITLGSLDAFAWKESALRRAVTLLPQRSVVMSGTVAAALRLADPDASDDALWTVLDAVQLAQTLRVRGGLGAVIAARGERFSGGEVRRLTLARALLRRPDLLLLDEPTEGLDEATAQAVLQGIRKILPRTAILVAAHRTLEIRFADRVVRLI